MSNNNEFQSINQPIILTLKDLEKWLNDLKNIILNINISINNINRMRLPKDEYEESILNYVFFSHFYMLSIFSVIIQLCKIFDNNRHQKRNFYELFNRLNNDKYDDELDELLMQNAASNGLSYSKTDINFQIDRLIKELAVNNDLINRISKLRNKCYAHTDPIANIPNVSFAELELLKNLSSNIYNSLSFMILNSTFGFDFTSDWAVDYPIRILALHRKEGLEKIANKLK